MEGGFWTLFLVLRAAGFHLCEVGVKPGSLLLPQTVQHFNEDLYPSAPTFILYLCSRGWQLNPILFGNVIVNSIICWYTQMIFRIGTSEISQ